MPTNTEQDGEKVKMSDGGISLNRWRALINDERPRLTPEETEKGWHYCYEFDGLLVGPADLKNVEWNCCTCFSEEEKASFMEKAKLGNP